MQQKENSLSTIFFNIIIPVIILNKGHKFGMSPQVSVVLALSFPLFFSIKSWFQSYKVNFVSLLGMLNVFVSGALTLLTLGGIWFAVKEATFPLLIGAFVFASSWSHTPFFQTLFMNPNTFDIAKVEAQLETHEKKQSFAQLMKKATLLLSISFLMSAVLNFVLALHIFTPLADSLTEVQKQELLNEQLSHMTMYSMLVILVPSIIFLGSLLFYTMKKIKEITGLSTDDLLLK